MGEEEVGIESTLSRGGVECGRRGVVGIPDDVSKGGAAPTCGTSPTVAQGGGGGTGWRCGCGERPPTAATGGAGDSGGTLPKRRRGQEAAKRPKTAAHTGKGE
uniref:Uncharacterized protein n=1 Tax=Oryza sativa subsp. japonica TaxID=39947 RepID=Q6K2J5_ORYSJ|nr:hypothetical protein [Oryza sativa Japonica Group]BAD22477.1 hypothetical protein [Oryza sativa Japonica Group]